MPRLPKPKGAPVGALNAAVFDRVAAEALAGRRELFDQLTPADQRLVVNWLAEALTDGRVENPLYQVLWEIDYARKPVDIGTFLKNEYYLGRSCGDLDEAWLRDMEQVFDPANQVVEWIFAGAIGTGKTTVAMAAMAYKLYCLSCLRDPAKYYGLLPGSLLVFGIYSITKRQVNDAGYYRLKGYIDRSPYFREHFPRDPRLDTKVVFTKHPVQVISGSTQLHALGLDLFCIPVTEPVPTQLGLVPAGELCAGVHQLATPTGWRDFDATVDTGLKECVAVELDDGSTITVSVDHMLLVDTPGGVLAWKRAGGLMPGDNLISLDDPHFMRHAPVGEIQAANKTLPPLWTP